MVRAMKRIEAVVQPFKLEDVKQVLTALGISGMTVSEVKGFGRQRGHSETYRGSDYRIEFVPKVKIEVIVPEGRLQEIVTAVVEAARTGSIGDGKIFVMPVADVVRIRTGETDEQAL